MENNHDKFPKNSCLESPRLSIEERCPNTPGPSGRHQVITEMLALVGYTAGIFWGKDGTQKNDGFCKIFVEKNTFLRKFSATKKGTK